MYKTSGGNRCGKKKSGISRKKTKGFIELIQKLAYRHNTWEVLSDFLLIAACTISNSVNPHDFKERESQYMETIEKHSTEETKLFSEILCELVSTMNNFAVDENLQDILGSVSHELNLHNERRGQYSPQYVADMMGMMISEKDPIIQDRGFVTLCEPTSGRGVSGVIVIGFAKAMQKAGHSYSTQMVVECTDIDIICVRMCYIQLSLYGIPAIVRQGNSLTGQIWSYWMTPVYIAHGWNLRSWWE